LEIRGAGSLFGYKQSGNISMVGFELYCEILKDEVDKIKTGDNKKIEPVVFLDTVAEINETYIKSRSVRVDFYFQLSRVKTKEDILFLREEVVDRFGPIPKEFNFLLNVALIKIIFRGSCLIKIKIMDSGLFLTLGGLGLFNKIEDLFDSVSSFKNESILNHHYEKDKENNLVIVFSTKNLETSFHLLFECEDLFTKKNE
jgi:transcription-repair coupling factor (superfamily II helicase)